MGDKSAIEWTEATWNPVTGCSKVSPGCAHCYAETLACGRFAGKPGYPGLPWTPANAAANVQLRPERLDQPLRWNKSRMIFVNSMSDLFHELVPAEFIAWVFAIMALAEQHTFQVLTKRAERMNALLGDNAFWLDVAAVLAERGDLRALELSRALDFAVADGGDPSTVTLPNVWLGVSIENRRYVHRADLLRETPAVVRFISAEPLIGPLLKDARNQGLTIGRPERIWLDGYAGAELELTGIDWLIVGGESGPGHRPIDPQWVRDLREACMGRRALCETCRLNLSGPGSASAAGLECPGCAGDSGSGGTAFFFKQDSGPRSGQRGRFADEQEWPREMPGVVTHGDS